MVAARLVDDDLRPTQMALSSPPESHDPDPAVWSSNRVALAKVLGKEQWDAVAEVYRAALTPRVCGRSLDAARDALAPLVAGKRYVVPHRWRNMLSRG
jgi:hypothetical protein